MPIATALANSNLDSNLSGTHYLALFSGNPESGGTELSGSGYARQAISFSGAANKKKTSAVAVEFPVATANWAWTHIAIYSASSGGTLKYYQPSAGATTAGDRAYWASGDVVVEYDGA